MLLLFGADIQQKQPHIGIKLLVTAVFGCFLRLYRFFSQSESLCICNTRDFMLKSRCLLGKSNNSVYRERAHSRAVLLESSCWWQLSELFISGEDGVLQLRVVNSAVHQFSWWKREFLRNSLINRGYYGFGTHNIDHSQMFASRGLKHLLRVWFPQCSCAAGMGVPSVILLCFLLFLSFAAPFYGGNTVISHSFPQKWAICTHATSPNSHLEGSLLINLVDFCAKTF